jgi:DNA (cytosine-5)-methyltransferase 1
MQLSAVDLFCGAGGLSLGLEQAGFETQMALDIDKDACATYRAAFAGKGIAVTCANASSFDFAPWKGVDLVAGGPPCQPFSTGGLRQGQKDERDLLPMFVRAVQDIEPQAFLLENVPGLATLTHQTYLHNVLNPLFECYTIFGPLVLNASDFGVPQSRRRLVTIGVRGAAIDIEKMRVSQRVDAGAVLTDKPKGEPNLSKIVYAKTPDLRPDPYHGQLFNGGGRAIDLTRPAPTILASAGGNKTHFIDIGNHVPPYHRHLMQGGAPRHGELPDARRLTVAESAALQTFPDGMVFHGARSSQYAQVGNAVPPKFAAALGVAIAEALTIGRRARAA